MRGNPQNREAPDAPQARVIAGISTSRVSAVAPALFLRRREARLRRDQLADRQLAASFIAVLAAFTCLCAARETGP
jgi:hypothetical protein